MQWWLPSFSRKRTYLIRQPGMLPEIPSASSIPPRITIVSECRLRASEFPQRIPSLGGICLSTFQLINFHYFAILVQRVDSAVREQIYIRQKDQRNS